MSSTSAIPFDPVDPVATTIGDIATLLDTLRKVIPHVTIDEKKKQDHLSIIRSVKQAVISFRNEDFARLSYFKDDLKVVYDTFHYDPKKEEAMKSNPELFDATNPAIPLDGNVKWGFIVGFYSALQEGQEEFAIINDGILPPSDKLIAMQTLCKKLSLLKDIEFDWMRYYTYVQTETLTPGQSPDDAIYDVFTGLGSVWQRLQLLLLTRPIYKRARHCLNMLSALAKKHDLDVNNVNQDVIGAGIKLEALLEEFRLENNPAAIYTRLFLTDDIILEVVKIIPYPPQWKAIIFRCAEGLAKSIGFNSPALLTSLKEAAGLTSLALTLPNEVAKETKAKSLTAAIIWGRISNYSPQKLDELIYAIKNNSPTIARWSEEQRIAHLEVACAVKEFRLSIDALSSYSSKQLQDLIYDIENNLPNAAKWKDEERPICLANARSILKARHVNTDGDKNLLTASSSASSSSPSLSSVSLSSTTTSLPATGVVASTFSSSSPSPSSIVSSKKDARVEKQ